MSIATKIRMAAGRAAPLNVAWLHAYWAGALSLSDTDPVDPWPDLVGDWDMTQVVGGVDAVYVAADSVLNDQPSVNLGDSTPKPALWTPYSPAPDPLPMPFSLVLIMRASRDEGFIPNLRVRDVGTASNQVMLGRADTGVGGLFVVDSTGDANGIRTYTSDLALAHLHVITVDDTPDDVQWTIDGNASTLFEGTWVLSPPNLISLDGNASTGGTGRVSFLGVYDGDVTADPGWDDFEAWAAATYDLTIA